MQNQYEHELDQLQEQWGGTEPAKDTGGPLPDGNYQVKVKECVLTRSKDKVPMVKWTLEVLAGGFAKRLMWKNSVILETTLPFLKHDLELFGIKLQKLSLLPTQVSRMVGKAVEVRRVTDGQYVNTYFNKLLSPPSSAAKEQPVTEEAVEATQGDDVPF